MNSFPLSYKPAADSLVVHCIEAHTGTGVSGRAAIHHARGELPLGETITIESIIGSRFDVSAQEVCQFGQHNAIIPRVTGSAHVCGTSQWIIDPADPLRHGFILR